MLTSPLQEYVNSTGRTVEGWVGHGPPYPKRETHTEKLINKLLTEKFVISTLKNLNHWTTQAQRHSNYLLTPEAQFPMTTREVTKFYTARDGMFDCMKMANKYHQLLRSTVKFYIATN